MALGTQISTAPITVEEGLDDIITMAAQRDPRKDSMRDVDSVYFRSTKDTEMEQDQKGRSSEQTGEEEQRAKSKEQRDRRSIELEARSLGLKIYTGETNRFPEKMQYEDIVEGLRKNKYKMSYTDKRTEQEIMGLLDKKKIKIHGDGLKTVPEDIFRKIRHGREQTSPSKHSKKPWQK